MKRKTFPEEGGVGYVCVGGGVRPANLGVSQGLELYLKSGFLT